VLTAGTNSVISIPQAGGTQNGYVTLMPLNYFVLTNFRASTNYDNAVTSAAFAKIGGQASALIRPFIPNNFTVAITRGSSNQYSNDPMTQAEIASSGYEAGKQMALPVVYGPRMNFSFVFTDTTGLFLSTGDGTTPLALQIQMYMEGYVVPQTKWNMFLNYFPALAGVMAPPAALS